MTRSRLNSNVRTRVNNMLAHRGARRIVGSAEDFEWGLVRAAIEDGGTPKQIAQAATRAILDARAHTARMEDIAHVDPTAVRAWELAVESAWMPRA